MKLLSEITNILFSNDISIIKFIYNQCSFIGNIFSLPPTFGLLLYTSLIILLINYIKSKGANNK